MFSGIIERTVKLVGKQENSSNINFTFKCDITSELKVDQSIAHNGVCLTVTSIDGDDYTVTAIDETLRLTNLGDLKIGEEVNFERCIRLSDRLDGHIVQGHVDGWAKVVKITDASGSWEFDFEFDNDFPTIETHPAYKLVIQKGSITINGTSLTVTRCNEKGFGVAIIPYTYNHTSFKTLKVEDRVNIELDVLGKYIAKLKA